MDTSKSKREEKDMLVPVKNHLSDFRFLCTIFRTFSSRTPPRRQAGVLQAIERGCGSPARGLQVDVNSLVIGPVLAERSLVSAEVIEMRLFNFTHKDLHRRTACFR